VPDTGQFHIGEQLRIVDPAEESNNISPSVLHVLRLFMVKFLL